MALVRAKVENISNQYVGRGGFSFPPRAEIEVMATQVGYAEISAHIHLKINEVSYEEGTADNARVLPDGLNSDLVKDDHADPSEGRDRGFATQGGASTADPFGDGTPTAADFNNPLTPSSGADAPEVVEGGTQDEKADDTYSESEENPDNEGATDTLDEGGDDLAPSNEGDVHASPEASQLALENNVNLKEVEGSGSHGKVLKKDVEKYLEEQEEGDEDGTS